MFDLLEQVNLYVYIFVKIRLNSNIDMAACVKSQLCKDISEV